MWTLCADVPAIRQKRLHHLVDDDDSLQWSGLQIADGLAFAFLQGQAEVRLEGERLALIVTIWPAGPFDTAPTQANDP